MLQGRPEQLQGGDRRRHRIARQTKKRLVAEAAKGKRPAWLEEQFPERHLAQFRHQRSNPIAVAGRHPARGYHHIAIQGQFSESPPQRLRLVWHHPALGHPGPQTAEQRLQQGAIALPDRPRPPRLRHRRQFIAADQQTNARLAPQRQFGHAATGQEPQLGRPQALTSRQQQLPRGCFLIGGANPAVGTGLAREPDGVIAVATHQFLGQHPAGAGRQRCAGEHPYRLIFAQFPLVGSPRGAAAHQAPAAARGGCGAIARQGIAIHDRSAETRHRLGRMHRLCAHPPQGQGQGQPLIALQGLQRLQQLIAGLLQGQPLAGKGFSHGWAWPPWHRWARPGAASRRCGRPAC